MQNIQMNNKIFNRSLKEMSNFGLPLKKADSVDIEYKLNSQGYRCNEFDNQEILILGCSQTEGHGLPLELTWPFLLSKKINKDYISLAKGGDGMQSQVAKAFQFFKEFYNPKYIFAVLPTARLEVPLINIQTNNQNKSNARGEKSPLKISPAMFSNKLIKKYSKEPHVIEDVLPEEFAIFYNVLFIKMLSQYCKSNGITLIWTDSKDATTEIESLKDIDDGYFDSPYLESIIKNKCHSDLSDHKFFNYAADYEYWPPGHWGLHQQTHIAESIYDKYIEKINQDVL
jgi:hypothetical protein